MIMFVVGVCTGIALVLTRPLWRKVVDAYWGPLK